MSETESAPSTAIDVARNHAAPQLADQSGEILMALQTLQRLAFAGQMGQQYGGRRDVAVVAGFRKDSELRGLNGYTIFRNWYDRSGVAARIVNLPVSDTWKNAPDIIELGIKDQTKSTFVTDFNALAKRLRLYYWFKQADILSRIGEFSVIFLGFSGVTTDQGLATEVTNPSPESLQYLAVYGQDRVRIASWVTNPSDKRFGLPETYEIAFGGAPFVATASGDIRGVSAPQSNGPESQRAIVHASRVMHIVENALDDRVVGGATLRRAMNDLDNLFKVSSATGEAFWQLADRVLQAKIEENMRLSDQAKTELKDQMEEIVHDLRRQFSAKGVSLDWMGGTVESPKDAVDLIEAERSFQANVKAIEAADRMAGVLLDIKT